MIHCGKDLPLSAEFHFRLCGVDIHVHRIEFCLQMEHTGGKFPHHLLILVGLLQRRHHQTGRGLIGSIAYESFRKVLSRFYDAMIKAEVGLVDIAWTRKQKFTEQIQDLSSQKDGELKELELDFREALTEAQ